MATVGHMNFFKVTQCGLYRMNVKEPKGYELEETFDSLLNWAKKRPMSATLPWDAGNLGSRSKMYLKDIHKDDVTGEFLVVLWKSDTDSAGGLWGAEEDSETGTGEVVKYTNAYKGKNVIWGRPCYYWIVPKLKSIVSIKFEHSVCDSQLLQDFIVACINNRVPHPMRIKTITERGATRISFPDDVNQYRYGYRFQASLRSLNTSSVELAKFAKTVTHVVRRETIEVNVPEERADWVKRFNASLPFVSAKATSKKRQIEIKAEANPTLQEIQEIIERYAKDGRKKTDWDNVGFYGDEGLTWVDRYRLKDELVLTDDIGGVLTASYLFEQINKHRDRFTTPIKQSLKEIAEYEADLKKEAGEQKVA